jgi:hypothetical protein
VLAARRFGGVAQSGQCRPDYVVPAVDTDQGVDPRDIPQQPPAVTLHEAAGYYHAPASAGPLAGDRLGNHLVGLSPGELKKTARIDHDNVGVGLVRGDDRTGLSQRTEHLLGIDEVLDAAQSHECNLDWLSHDHSRFVGVSHLRQRNRP